MVRNIKFHITNYSTKVPGFSAFVYQMCIRLPGVETTMLFHNLNKITQHLMIMLHCRDKRVIYNLRIRYDVVIGTGNQLEVVQNLGNVETQIP